MKDVLDKNNCQFATVAMADTNGLLRGQKVSRGALDGILQRGMGMAPAQLALDPTDEILDLPGVTDESGDFHDSSLQVDPDSVRNIPWEAPGHDLLFLSNFTGDTAALCPRAILKSVLERGKEMGLVPKYGMEVEFTLFNETPQSLEAKGYRNLTPATPFASHDLVLYQTAQSDWYRDVAGMCAALKIDLAKMHEEIGPGFMEVCTGAGTGLAPADQTVLLKNFLRALAMRQDRTVCFMPRWSEDADSQSTHIHISLTDADGTSLFWNGDAKDGATMSPTFRHFIGGMQAHVGDMMLLFAPTVNSYRRFCEGTFAPPALSWGVENRTTCFRVVGDDPATLRVENRLPGADSNPYLVVAATLAAGFAGIAGKLEPTAETRGNGYVPGAGQGPEFPRVMGESIARLQASAMARDWLGDAFVDGFSATRSAQEAAFQAKVPDTELRRFFQLG